MTKITYLVTVFNEIKTVEKAIKDVLNIKFKNKEIIVIDNGSNDGSKEIIEKFTHIKSVLRKKNEKLSVFVKVSVSVSFDMDSTC